MYHKNSTVMNNVKVIAFFSLVFCCLVLIAFTGNEYSNNNVVQVDPKFLKFKRNTKCTVSFANTLRKGQRVQLFNVTQEETNVLVLYHTSVGSFYSEAFNDDIVCVEA